MKRLMSLAMVVASCVMSQGVQAATEIKFAMLAPPGSSWANVIRDWDAELQSATNGAVKLKIYAGGVAGDEQDVIRKMRIGQLHAAVLTGLGLGVINPEVRVLELPFMFDTTQEIDAVVPPIQEKLAARFPSRGYELLGWSETGFVNIFSTHPIATRDQLKKSKMWAWEGDKLVEGLCGLFGITPIKLSPVDVLTSLQTDLIDTVYAPPLGAIAMQWFTRTPFMTATKLANSTGAIVISTKAMQHIPEQHRAAVRETAKKYARIMVERTRADNESSAQLLGQKYGVTTVQIPPSELEEIRKIALQLWDNMAGKLYPPELLVDIKQRLVAYRQHTATEVVQAATPAVAAPAKK